MRYHRQESALHFERLLQRFGAGRDGPLELFLLLLQLAHVLRQPQQMLVIQRSDLRLKERSAVGGRYFVPEADCARFAVGAAAVCS